MCSTGVKRWLSGVFRLMLRTERGRPCSNSSQLPVRQIATSKINPRYQLGVRDGTNPHSGLVTPPKVVQNPDDVLSLHMRQAKRRVAVEPTLQPRELAVGFFVNRLLKPRQLPGVKLDFCDQLTLNPFVKSFSSTNAASICCTSQCISGSRNSASAASLL